MANQLNDLLQYYGVSGPANITANTQPVPSLSTNNLAINSVANNAGSNLSNLAAGANSGLSSLAQIRPNMAIGNTQAALNNLSNNFATNISSIPQGALNVVAQNSSNNLNDIAGTVGLSQIQSDLAKMQSLKQGNVPYSQPNQLVAQDSNYLNPITKQQVLSQTPYDFNTNQVIGNVQTYGPNHMTATDVANLLSNASSSAAANANTTLNSLKSTGLTNQQIADISGKDLATVTKYIDDLTKSGTQTYGPNKLTAADVTKILADPSSLVFTSGNYNTATTATNNAVKSLKDLGLTDQQIADITGQSVSFINRYTQTYGNNATAAQIYNFAKGSQGWSNAYDLIRRQDMINGYGLNAQQFANIMGISVADAQNYLNGVNASGDSARAALSSYH